MSVRPYLVFVRRNELVYLRRNALNTRVRQAGRQAETSFLIPKSSAAIFSYAPASSSCILIAGEFDTCGEAGRWILLWTGASS
eukprot:747582-Hanusia_phi.AAC.1